MHKQEELLRCIENLRFAMNAYFAIRNKTADGAAIKRDLTDICNAEPDAREEGKLNNHYSVLEYLERSGRLSKSRERDACRIDASKALREIEINTLAENKPDRKAYHKFKRKPYSVGGFLGGGESADRRESHQE